MYRKLTGPVRAQLIRDSAQWGSHIKNLCEHIDVLIAVVGQLRALSTRLVTENKTLLVKLENRDAEIKSLRFEHYNCPEEQRWDE